MTFKKPLADEGGGFLPFAMEQNAGIKAEVSSDY